MPVFYQISMTDLKLIFRLRHRRVSMTSSVDRLGVTLLVGLIHAKKRPQAL